MIIIRGYVFRVHGRRFIMTLVHSAPRAICHDCPKFHHGFNVSPWLHDAWLPLLPLASPLLQFSNDNAAAASRCPLSGEMGLHTYRAAETCSRAKPYCSIRRETRRVWTSVKYLFVGPILNIATFNVTHDFSPFSSYRI